MIDGALERFEREEMMAALYAAIERLAADPVAGADWKAEIAELEGSLNDGLEEYLHEGIEELIARSEARSE